MTEKEFFNNMVGFNNIANLPHQKFWCGINSEVFIHGVLSKYAYSFAAMMIMLLILMFASLQRNHTWSGRIIFWSDVVLKSPHKTRSHNNLGSAFIAAGRCDDAMPSLAQSIKIDRWYIEPHYNLAICHVKKSRFDAAIPELEEVIRINVVLKKGHYGVSTAPRFEMQAHSTLGNIYNMKGMFDKAVFHFHEALKLSPEDAVTRFNLALTYETMGMLKEAKAELEEVLKINPMDEGAKRGIKRLEARADTNALN